MTTTTELARRFRVDVETSPGVFTQLIGLKDLNPKIDATMQDASDYESDGWGADEKTFQKWSLEITALRKKVDGVANAAMLALITAEDQFGTTSQIKVRWYDKNGGTEAYEGTGTVQVERAATGVTDLETAKVTISGVGPRETITNPLADLDPVIASVSDNDAADGALIYLTGMNFTGATDVDFGVTAATLFTVINDNTIAVVVPTLTSGSKPITVTTPEGTSNSIAFTAP